MIKLNVGEVYIQRPLFKTKEDDEKEYVVITEINEDNVLFDLYFKDPISGLLNKSPGEGRIQQLNEGFKDGDIEKAMESDFIAWQALLLLIEKND